MQKKIFNRSQIKAASIDLDGTILEKGIVHPRDREAIEKLSASGVETIISTGRHPFTLPKAVTDIQSFHRVIGSNGAIIADIREKRIDHFDGITIEMMKEFIDHLYTFTDTFHFTLMDGTGFMTRPGFDELISWEETEAAKQRAAAEFTYMYHVIDDPAEIRDVKEPVSKLGYRVKDKSQLLPTMRRINALFGLETALTDHDTVEVTKPGVTKGTGLVMVCEDLGIKPENVIVFGDSGNDAPIMKLAGYGVAMGNAHDYLKQFADEITEPIEEQGFAKAVERLFDL